MAGTASATLRSDGAWFGRGRPNTKRWKSMMKRSGPCRCQRAILLRPQVRGRSLSGLAASALQVLDVFRIGMKALVGVW
jgi:hypothetical protein